MPPLKFDLNHEMRAHRPKALRHSVHIDKPRGWRDHLRWAAKLVFGSVMFVGGFAGGFVVVLYAIQLPGFPRFP
jgi:hypothetical protein